MIPAVKDAFFTEPIEEDQVERARELLQARVRLRVVVDVKKLPWYFGGGSTATVTVSGPEQQVIDAHAEFKDWLAKEWGDRW